MGKWLMVVFGAILTTLGIIGIILRWEAVWQFIVAGVILAILFVGAAMLIFGFGELMTKTGSPPSPETESISEESKEPAAHADDA